MNESQNTTWLAWNTAISVSIRPSALQLSELNHYEKCPPCPEV